MKQPANESELKSLHELLRTDPTAYLKITNEWISENPLNPQAYVDRHLGWMRLGQPRRALDDMDTAIKLEPDPMRFFSRAEVHKHLGEYEDALRDFARSEALIPDEWDDLGFGLLQQADCHARLGNEGEALACCERLGNNFWTPGLGDAPAGDKKAVASRLKVLAAEAHRSRG